jgi:hypothetical protein
VLRIDPLARPQDTPVFASNLVLHSGVDDERGRFVAAYGIETDASESAPVGLKVSNALSTRSRSSH